MVIILLRLDTDDPQNVLFISIHGYNENDPIKFYPGTGDDHRLLIIR